MSNTVAACPVCGAFAVNTLSQPPALLAVCDVLVVRALEVVGKRVVRVERNRFQRWQHINLPWHLAHTIWQPNETIIEKSLAGAWDVVPAMLASHGCCGVTTGQVVTMLDKYVRDLLVTGTRHNLEDLRYRFQSQLGINVAPLTDPYLPSAVS